jgi:hypothetical protein
MARTYKDCKSNQKYNKRVTSHKAGVKKQFKRASAKKARRTPILSMCVDTHYTIKKVKRLIEIEEEILIPEVDYTYVENSPRGLDPWLLD